MFQNYSSESRRLIYTASLFSRNNLLYLQEIGTLSAIKPHASSRQHLSSYLFFIVLSGKGELVYGGNRYELKQGDCVFVDCRIPYSHSTINDLWSLMWVHFNAVQMKQIYEEYKNSGGKVVFSGDDDYISLMYKINDVARSSSNARDIELSALLTDLIAKVMKTSWNALGNTKTDKKSLITEVRCYIDDNYNSDITLALLATKYFINKTYLSELFKEQYGVGVNEYLQITRITKAKELLRFTDMSMGEIADAIGVSSGAYFSRLFKKTEGLSPYKWKEMWNTNSPNL